MTETDTTPTTAEATAAQPTGWSPPRAHTRRDDARRQPLSVVICTRDEEELITRVIHSVAFADEVVVCDSGSTDRTRELAVAAGARVVAQRWLGYAPQKNHAAAAATHDWILSLDTDEIVTPELARAIDRALRDDPDPRIGFAIDRRGTFRGRLLANTERRSTRAAYVRLYHRDHGAWDETMPIHEMVRVPGGITALDGVLVHDRAFSMDDYFRVFNRNATVEAELLLRAGRRIWGVEVVMRPIMRFVWCYVVKRDVRLGGGGIVHAALRACSDLMRYAKAWESQRDPGTDRFAPGRHRPARR